MEDIKISVVGGIQKIVFNRPKKQNAITTSMYVRITEALNSAAVDDNILLTVLTGQGKFYCSGNDLTGDTTYLENATDDFFQTVTEVLRRFVAAFIDYPKLLVAVVNGPAIGVAVTTLGLCDIVFTSDKAYFWTPFVQLGLTAEGCSSLLFSQIMGPRKAAEMLYLGHKMSAKEAYEYGLVTKVVPHSTLTDLWELIQKFTSLQKGKKCIYNKLVEIGQKAFHVQNFFPYLTTLGNTTTITPFPLLGWSLLSVKRLVSGANRSKLHDVNNAECKELEKRLLSGEFINTVQKFMMRKSSKL